MTPEDCLALLGGVARRGTLRRAGVSDWALASARSRGTISSPRRGIYALPDADRIAVASVAWNCHPTCVTAARRRGLPVLHDPTELHMAFAPDRSSAAPHVWPRRGIKVHMSARLRWRSELVADAIDASARCVTALEQLVMVDGALNRGLMTEGDLAQFMFTSATRRRWLARHCDPACQSPLETLTRVALKRARLDVRSQVDIPGVGRVDFLVNGVVIVETDGRGTHTLAGAFDEDRRRDRAAVLAGFVVLRFTYRDVMDRMPAVVAEVQAAARLWSRAAA